MVLATIGAGEIVVLLVVAGLILVVLLGVRRLASRGRLRG